MQLSTMNQSQMMILESFAGARDEQEEHLRTPFPKFQIIDLDTFANIQLTI